MTKAHELPKLSLLNKLFEYNPETGDLVRKVTTSSRARKGMVVSQYNTGDYRRVRINNVMYQAHRLIWYMVTKDQPDLDRVVDHRNGKRYDNRWSNLRLTTKQVNSLNIYHGN